MSDPLLIVGDDWLKYSGAQLDNAIATYGDLNNIKLALGAGDASVVAIAVDDTLFPTPYTGINGMLIGEDVWIQFVLSDTLN